MQVLVQGQGRLLIVDALQQTIIGKRDVFDPRLPPHGLRGDQRGNVGGAEQQGMHVQVP